MAESVFSEAQHPQQKHNNDNNNNNNSSSSTPFPLILTPNFNSSSSSTFSFVDAIKSNKSWLCSRLHSSGAILFRGFPVSTAADFNDVVEAFGFDELPYVGGAAPRSKVVGRVSTANESPPSQIIAFHHEMAYVPEFPSKVFFFCEVEPKRGGETPIALSHVIHDRMKEKHPEFVRELEEHGLSYVRVLGEEDNPSSYIGNGWKTAFSTHDKNVVEQKAAKLGLKLEWLEDGVKTIMGPIPAIRMDESRQRKVWFNSMVAAYVGWDDERNDPMKTILFGDGRTLPRDVLRDCQEILEEESVTIPWQKGDVLLIDNMAALHSRNAFEPPRRVLASLCK